MRENEEGSVTIKRKSIAKRLRAKLQELKVQLVRWMHRPVAEVGKWLRSVVQGWMNYHAVPGNIRSLDQFRTQTAHAGCTSYGGESEGAKVDLGAVGALDPSLVTDTQNPSPLSQ